jgi:Fic family protein
MKKDIVKTVEDLDAEYNELNLIGILDYEKYKLYSIVTSSTQLEGSTLDEIDTKLLLDDGLTASGKSLEHHLMVKDNYNAMKFALNEAEKKTLLSPEFLKKCNSLNMEQTGKIQNTLLGVIVDGRRGEFRQDGAFAVAIGTYPDYRKIPGLIDLFCKEYNKQLTNNTISIENLITSFDAHVNLVLIHPWMDGNKRTSRLIMNFIQKRSGLPLTKVHQEDSREYIFALKNVKETDRLEDFRDFMLKQHIKTLKNEIDVYKRNSKKGFHLVF